MSVNAIKGINERLKDVGTIPRYLFDDERRKLLKIISFSEI